MATIMAATLLLAACGSTSKPADAPAGQAALSAPTPAQVTPAAAGLGAPTTVERYLMKQGVQIPTAFMSASGLKAIVADNGQERRLMYVAPDGQSLIVGMVYDAEGRNVTTDDMSRASVRDTGTRAALSSAQLDELWQRAEKLQWIEEGTGGRVVYAVVDPTCPYCHRLWHGVREAIAAGQVRVRWLPVAILSNSSKGLAAAVYQAQDRDQAMVEMVDNRLTPVTVDKETAVKLAKNLLFLRDTGYTGVPLLLFKDAAGAVGVEPELPSDPKFKQIFGA